MSHFPKHVFGTARIFTDIVTTQLEGDRGCGSDFDVEVEFTATPDIPAQTCGPAENCYPAEGGEREIVAIRAIKYKSQYAKASRDGYRDLPDWMIPYIEECIDLYAKASRDGYRDLPDWMIPYLEECVALYALDADFSEEGP